MTFTFPPLDSRGADPAKDPDILKCVQEQTKQWTELMTKHRKEEWEILKTHLASQEEVFKKLHETVSAKQMKDMDAFFAK